MAPFISLIYPIINFLGTLYPAHHQLHHNNHLLHRDDHQNNRIRLLNRKERLPQEHLEYHRLQSRLRLPHRHHHQHRGQEPRENPEPSQDPANHAHPKTPQTHQQCTRSEACRDLTPIISQTDWQHGAHLFRIFYYIRHSRSSGKDYQTIFKNYNYNFLVSGIKCALIFFLLHLVPDTNRWRGIVF